ncbi:hypothetical protein CHUAL_002575 [Chamberlinius hualienensis]
MENPSFLPEKSSSERITNVFRGNDNADKEIDICCNQVKIFVSSAGSDFQHERQQLFTVVLPQLQNQFRNQGLDIQMVDSCGLQSDLSSINPLTQAQILKYQLTEIRECHRISPACFFLGLIGNKSGCKVLPQMLTAEEYQRIVGIAAENAEDGSFISQLYEEDKNCVPSVFKLRKASFTTATPVSEDVDSNQGDHQEQIQTWTKTFFRFYQKVKGTEHQIKSMVEEHFSHAMQLDAESSTSTIVCIVRTIQEINVEEAIAKVFVDDANNSSSQNAFINSISSQMEGRNNYLRFRLSLNDKGFDTGVKEIKDYLQKFSQDTGAILKQMITANLAQQTNLSNLSSPVQDLFEECICHQSINRQLQLGSKSRTQNLYGFDFLQPYLNKIEKIMCLNRNDNRLHGPIIVIGREGCGKSSLLATTYSQCSNWLNGENGGKGPTVRIVRYAGRTLSSGYTPLLIQSLFCQLTLSCNLNTSPIHPNMDLMVQCSHLQMAIELVGKSDFQVVVVIDDMQQLENPTFEQIVLDRLISWNLPPNIHFVCSLSFDHKFSDKLWTNLNENSAVNSQIIEMTEPVMSEQSLNASVDNFLSSQAKQLQPNQKRWVVNTLSQCPATPFVHSLLANDLLGWTSQDEIEENKIKEDKDALVGVDKLVKQCFQNLEKLFAKHAIAQMAQHLTSARYGLAEWEILELMNFSDDVFLSFGGGDQLNYQHSTINGRPMSALAWSNIKHAMKGLLEESLVSNKPLVSWRHQRIQNVAKQLYLRDKVARTTHSDIANLFLSGFLSDSEDSVSSRQDVDSKSIIKFRQPTPESDHKSQSGDNRVIVYSFRQIDQLWYHLLHAKDISRVKQITSCNFDFLFAALCTVSVRYVLCILDQIRSQILDFEIELIYHIIRLSLNILCKNPLEFAPVVISWLRPYGEVRLGAIDAMVSQAMEWCDSSEVPLLVPLNNWVWNPVPESAFILPCPLGVTCFVLSRDCQTIICGDNEKAIHVYCLPSQKRIKTYTGHYGKVTCLHVSETGNYLISGSEDTTSIVWDIQTCRIKHRISEHIATVTCVSTTADDSLIISGSEDSRVLIAEMETGKVVYKLEHHRGMISCLVVANDVEILITGAADSAVCVWSLENFTLLNTLNFSSPVVKMDVSIDRTFLLIACEDNKLYLRSMTTGSEIHTIEAHDSPVLSMCIANDNCRTLIGCEDHRVYMYDLHTTKLLRTFNGHDGPVTGIKVTPDDGLMFTSGGGIIKTWYFSPVRDGHGRDAHQAGNKKQQQEYHSAPVVCVDVSKDGTLGLSGSVDGTVKVWQLGTSSLRSTLEGHTGPITSVSCAPSSLFAASGSQDKTVRIWGLTLGHIVSTFKEHDAPISAVKVAADSRRVLSADIAGSIKLWGADNGLVTHSWKGPTSFIDLTTNIKFAICGDNGNSVHLWTLSPENQSTQVHHKEPILCHALTIDSRHLITGSKDKSLKVWDVVGGKLTQVLVGHTAAVTCVALAPLNRVMVISGSDDCNVIAWDMQTGNIIHTLSGHSDAVTSVQLSVDGNSAVSGSKDQCICVWDSQSGQIVTAFNVHSPILHLAMTYDAGHILVHLKDCERTPLLCYHNCPLIDIQAFRRLEKAIEKESSLQAALPRKVHRRILQKEMSLDTYTWQKKYGNVPGKRSFSSSLEDFNLSSASPISSSTQNLNNLSTHPKVQLNSSFFEEVVAVWDGSDPTETPTKSNPPSTFGCSDTNGSDKRSGGQQNGGSDELNSQSTINDTSSELCTIL